MPPLKTLVTESVDALIAVRKGLSPETPNFLQMWNESNTECDQWTGITCDNEGKVTEM